MNIGDFVADAHDGVEVDGYVYDQKIQIHCEGSAEIVKQIMKQAGIEKTYINKYVVVVDYGINGTFKAVYAYDDRYLGMVTYREAPKHNGP